MKLSKWYKDKIIWYCLVIVYSGLYFAKYDSIFLSISVFYLVLFIWYMVYTYSNLNVYSILKKIKNEK